MRVLIADDSPTIVRILKAMAEKSGYEVETARDGREALEKLQKNDIFLAILDWEMPRLSGLQVCRALHRIHHFVYVIILTSKDGTHNLEMALEAGANDFLTKSSSEEELRIRLRAGERMFKMQMQLASTEKLQSIGQLAAGIAHEINTPTHYVGDNTRFLQDAFNDLLRLIQQQQILFEQSLDADVLARIQQTADEVDLPYLIEEIPKAIGQTLEGVEHIARIVRSMKDFSHPDGVEKVPVDLNKMIRNTLTIARSEWKYVAEIETDFDDSLVAVPCLEGSINQAILNLITNAAHAIEEVVKDTPQRKGVIRIQTRREEDYAVVHIHDTGGGIPQKIRSHIFDPFFTTKDVGKGTGQGLSIVYTVIVDKHQGEIHVDSTVGQGTTFTLRLPLRTDVENQDSLSSLKGIMA